jgi:membrane protease YdiL (CAAX protease family)
MECVFVSDAWYTKSAPSFAKVRKTLRNFFRIMSHWALLRVLVMAVMLLATVIITPRVLNLAIPPDPSPWRPGLVALRNLLVAAATVWTYARAVRWLEDRPASEIKFRADHLLGGTLLGMALISAVYLLLWSLGCATFAPGTGLADLGFALIGVFGVALAEELLFRAIVLRITEEAFGTLVAVLLSMVIFGLAHSLNRGATPTGVMAIALEAGVLLALAYVVTRNLWLAVGIHLGWNFCEGNLYGATVSGTAAPHSFFRATLAGPQSLTGGIFGPEASVVSIGICLAAAAVLLALIVRKNGWRPLGFQLTLP